MISFMQTILRRLGFWWRNIERRTYILLRARYFTGLAMSEHLGMFGIVNGKLGWAIEPDGSLYEFHLDGRLVEREDTEGE